MTTKIYNRQWLGDKSLELAGNMLALFELARENELSITDDLIAGSMINSDLSDDIITDKEVLRYYAGKIHPATALTAEDIAAEKGGIGYMGIQIDFKVSPSP